MNTEEQKSRPGIAVILFTKNEERHIAKVIERLKPFLKELPPSELFIYDDSTDNTLEIAKKSGVIPLKGFKLGLGQSNYFQACDLHYGSKTFVFRGPFEKKPLFIRQVCYLKDFSIKVELCAESPDTANSKETAPFQ